MRQQHYLLPTLRDVPADAEVHSHQLMLRAGLMRQLASGIYTYLPLGYKVLRKVENIVREEMDRAGGQEIQMPAIHPAELWRETGRWDVYGPELMRLHDRHDREFALGPTHEEVVTGLLRDDVKSYKKLPLNVYQIQNKFRDERRPRFGVLRSREFLMKDAYSFDVSEEGLAASYEAMYTAYMAIFERCGLDFRPVEADSGAIGGTGTHEFMVLSDIGEDTIAYCDSCLYAANLEKAEVAITDYEQIDVVQPKQVKEQNSSESEKKQNKIHTPQMRTIEQLTQFLQVDKKNIVKTVAFNVDGQNVLVLTRGDYSINDIKVKNLLNAEIVELVDEAKIVTDLHSVPGYIGPVDVEDVKIIADFSVKGMQGAVVGANEQDTHMYNVTPDQDFMVEQYADLREIEAGDPCPRCQGHIQFARGIEVGHVFKLGTKYSEAMGASFLDENGKSKPMIMGCYGIGVSRTLAAIIEQNHDENGLMWPMSVAPFHVHLIVVSMKDEQQKQLAEDMYAKLQREGFDVLFDDRNERPGVKFKDADLIGIPMRVTIGKKASEGIVECKLRRSGDMDEIAVDKLMPYLHEKRGAYDDIC